MRRIADIAVPVVTATLALATAGWAATAGVGPLDGDVKHPLAVAALATGPLVADDRDGTAILSADALVPGQSRAGEVTIANAGDAAGAFTLSSGGASRGALSGVLELTVLDVTRAPAVALFHGSLADFAPVALGTLQPGEGRRYRFEVVYPAGRPATLDNALQGASTWVTFAWDAVATSDPAPPPPAPAPATPVPSAPAPAPSAAPAAGPPAGAAPPRAPALALAVTLGTATRSVARGRLDTWMASTVSASARITGTVTVAGRTLKVPPVTVKLTPNRRRVLLRLPRAAVAPGAKRVLTVRLTIAAASGSKRVTVRRTLRVAAR